MHRVTHGVIRVTSQLKGAVKINGKQSKIAYVMPPAHVDITGPEDCEVTTWGALEDCTMKDLRGIVRWMGIKTEAKTKAGLISAIERKVDKDLKAEMQ